MSGLRGRENKDFDGEEVMSIKIRFFARFQELLGTDIEVEGGGGSTLGSIVKNIAQKSRDGHDAIFDGQGKSREFVILMRNGKRVGTIDADSIPAEEGVEIAVFPPVAGG